MTAGVLLVLGLLLCFGGSRSVRLAVLVAGAGVGWVLAAALGGSTATAALVAVGSAVVCLGLSIVLTRFVMLGLGGVLGAQIGASAFAVLGGDQSWLLAAVFVLAVGTVGALLAERYRRPVVAVVAALAGSSVVLTALDALDGDTGDGLRDLGSDAAVALYVLLWLGLAAAGLLVQRPRRGD